MAAIKHALQRDVFTPHDERLLGVAHVGKVGGKKKKSSFLCASVSIEHPPEVFVSSFKKLEKLDSYKKQKVWSLKELRLVNGKDANKETAEFELQFEKNFKWSAGSVGEKQTFLSCLWKLCHRYLPRQQRPTFTNIPQSLLEISVSGSGETLKVSAGTEDEVLEDYQALTEQEEQDLERMMRECETAISDAEAFTGSLSRDLSVLDGKNIHSIMGSEHQVALLMLLLDKALNEVSTIESRLDEYDVMVEGISTQMGQIRNQESFIQITNKNHQRLLEDLDTLVMQLDLSKGHIKALREMDLNKDSSIEACTSAAEALQQAMEVELPKGLSKLQAVSEQQKLFHELRQVFAQRLFDHLSVIFERQANEPSGGNLVKSTEALKLPKHFPFHRDLLSFRQLILWIKNADKTKYTSLITIYTKNINKLYSKEIKEFMTAAKQRFIQQELSSSIKNLSGSQQSLSKKKKFGGSTQTLAVKGVTKRLKGIGKKKALGGSRESLATSDFELSDREKFSSTFREVLSELEPTCQDEENFLTKLFHVNIESSDTMMPGGSDDEEDDSEEGVARRRKYQHSQIVKEKRLMMSEVFSAVEAELSSLIQFGEELDPLNSLNMLVVIGHRVAQAQQANDGSFLTKMLGNSLIEVKRNFDNFIQAKVQSIRDFHISKSKRIGFLPFVLEFEDFIELSEGIFREAERRTDIDKAYKMLIQAVFDAIEGLASDPHQSHKTPPEVVMFENYHHLLNCLSSLKIASLDQERREVKRRYGSYLSSYVTNMLGRPLEKLSNFFEGVEQVLDAGVRAEEVGFQLKFSQQELRRCIREYNGKDVKKGLEALHHKIVKHTSASENRLLRVVWQHMQEEFLKQYSHFQDLIDKCYAGSGIKMEFTIENVLAYFSDITYKD